MVNSWVRRSFELQRQPGARELPVAQHRLRGDAEDRGGIFDAQSSEVAQLNHLRATWFASGQSLQGVVECAEVGGAIGARCGERIQVPRAVLADALQITPALRGGAGAGGVDEHAAHDRRGHGKEVGTVLPIHRARIDETDVRFMHQRRGVRPAFGSLPSEVLASQLAQMVVDERRQAVERRCIAATPCLEKSRDVGERWHPGLRPIVCFAPRFR